MEYDLSKLHPIHQEAMKQHLVTLQGFRTPDGRLATDVAYETYLNLNQRVPDIIGKDESEMTKKQKTRIEAIVAELETTRQATVDNPEK